MYLKRIFMMLFCVCFCALVIQGCFSSGHHRGGSLSDAMEKASDEDEEDRTVDTYPDPDEEEIEDEDDYALDLVAHPAQHSGEDSLLLDSSVVEGRGKTTWLTLAGGTGLTRQDDFYGLSHFHINLGAFFESQQFVELSAGMSHAPVQKTSTLNASLDGGVTLLHLGLAYKYYFTPGHTFMGIYLCVGAGYAYMRWSYKNPIEAMAYDEYGNPLGLETIRSDGVSGFELYTGSGINFIQTESLQLGLEVLPGLILWGGETSEGFDNDVFDPFYYTKFRFYLRFAL